MTQVGFFLLHFLGLKLLKFPENAQFVIELTFCRWALSTMTGILMRKKVEMSPTKGLGQMNPLLPKDLKFQPR